VAPFPLSQVPLELDNEGNKPIPMQAPKDSGEITSLADKLINLWHPNRVRFGCGDNLITLYMAKDRHGAACHQADLHFISSEYRIENMVPKPVELPPPMESGEAA
jgi:hypothetical protein